jgi:hypothetical protein
LETDGAARQLRLADAEPGFQVIAHTWTLDVSAVAAGNSLDRTAGGRHPTRCNGPAGEGEILLAKIAVGSAVLLLLIPVMIGQSVSAVVDALLGSSMNTTIDCTSPIADIPPECCLLYVTAVQHCPGLDWTVLAAIGKIETDHGRLKAPGVTEGENYANTTSLGHNNLYVAMPRSPADWNRIRDLVLADFSCGFRPDLEIPGLDLPLDRGIEFVAETSRKYPVSARA